MSITQTSPIRTLKNLIQILHDGQEGFKKASENVKDSSLKELFSQLSLQRSRFIGELESELLTLGEEDPQKEGSTLAGTVHRGWIDLKAAFSGNDNHAVLAEAERGEDTAKKAYHDALEEGLPAPIHQVVARQAAHIQEAHDEIKMLRDTEKAKQNLGV